MAGHSFFVIMFMGGKAVPPHRARRGGYEWMLPIGRIQKAPIHRFAIASISQSCTCLGTMRPLIVRGRAIGFQLKLNGSAPPAADSIRRLILGATN